MKDSYTNWRRALFAGVILTLARAGCRYAGGAGGMLIFGTAFVLIQLQELYSWPGCVSIRGRFTRGSLVSMMFWNFIGAWATALVLFLLGWDLPAEGMSPVLAFGLGLSTGTLEAEAYRANSQMVTFLCGAVIGACGLPHFAAVDPSVFHSGDVKMTMLTYLAVLVANRAGARLWEWLKMKG